MEIISTLQVTTLRVREVGDLLKATRLLGIESCSFGSQSQCFTCHANCSLLCVITIHRLSILISLGTWLQLGWSPRRGITVTFDTQSGSFF